VRSLAALAAVLCFAFAAPAAAQMVSRSEDGRVRYQLGQPVGLDQPVDVARGDAVWAEYIRPAHVVRTTTAGADRPGEHRAPGVPEGSILFAYTLRGGFAYCPLIAPDAHRVQCYRDFDGDGTFEGSYVTISRHLDSMVFPGGLRGLTGMPRVSYVQASVEDAPVVNGQVVFVGFQRGAPRFRIRVEDEFMQDPARCELDGNAECTVYGVRLRVLPLGDDRARIELVGAAAQRLLTVCFDTEAVGDGCR